MRKKQKGGKKIGKKSKKEKEIGSKETEKLHKTR
jgi:hypothetical protein